MIFINNSAVFIIYCISDTFISSIIAKNLDKGEHVKILPLINLKRVILRHSLCKQFYCAILWIRAMPLRIPSCTPEAKQLAGYMQLWYVLQILCASLSKYRT